MNHITDACNQNPEVYAEPATPAEIVSAIINARAKGWRISGPDTDGSYVTLEPPFVDVKTGHIFTPPVLRVPDGTFLIDYLKVGSPLLQVVQASACETHRSPCPSRMPDLYLVDP